MPAHRHTSLQRRIPQPAAATSSASAPPATRKRSARGCRWAACSKTLRLARNPVACSEHRDPNRILVARLLCNAPSRTSVSKGITLIRECGVVLESARKCSSTPAKYPLGAVIKEGSGCFESGAAVTVCVYAFRTGAFPAV